MATCGLHDALHGQQALRNGNKTASTRMREENDVESKGNKKKKFHRT